MGKRSGQAFGKTPSKSLKAAPGTHDGARPWVDRMLKSLETRTQSWYAADHSRHPNMIAFRVKLK